MGGKVVCLRANGSIGLEGQLTLARGFADYKS